MVQVPACIQDEQHGVGVTVHGIDLMCNGSHSIIVGRHGAVGTRRSGCCISGPQE